MNATSRAAFTDGLLRADNAPLVQSWRPEGYRYRALTRLIEPAVAAAMRRQSAVWR
jgi:hypothetical protein